LSSTATTRTYARVSGNLRQAFAKTDSPVQNRTEWPAMTLDPSKIFCLLGRQARIAATSTIERPFLPVTLCMAAPRGSSPPVVDWKQPAWVLLGVAATPTVWPKKCTPLKASGRTSR
jgi:hypothetical protein